MIIFTRKIRNVSKHHTLYFIYYSTILQPLPNPDFLLKQRQILVDIKKAHMQKTNLRVPSKRVAIVSKKVFCGAKSPFRAGIGGYRNRDLSLTSPTLHRGKKGKQDEY